MGGFCTTAARLIDGPQPKENFKHQTLHHESARKIHISSEGDGRSKSRRNLDGQRSARSFRRDSADPGPTPYDSQAALGSARGGPRSARGPGPGRAASFKNVDRYSDPAPRGRARDDDDGPGGGMGGPDHGPGRATTPSPPGSREASPSALRSSRRGGGGPLGGGGSRKPANWNGETEDGRPLERAVTGGAGSFRATTRTGWCKACGKQTPLYCTCNGGPGGGLARAKSMRY